MDKIFLHILDMSVTASYVILFVMAMRLLLKKCPKVFSYALWLPVLFRLICPFSIKGFFSLIPSKTQTMSQDIIRAINRPTGGEAVLAGGVAHGSVQATGLVSSVDPMQIWISTGTAVWIAGVALLVCYSIIAMFRLSKRLMDAEHVSDNVYEISVIKTPFVFGIMNPRIYIPDNLSENEKSYIVRHEETHIKRFDHIIKPLAFLTLCLHWFNPLVWAGVFLMSEDMELSCDESVIRSMGSGIKKDYSSSLLSISAQRRTMGACPLAFGESNPKGRIKNILNYRKPSFWVIILAVVIVSAISIGLITNPDVSDKIVEDKTVEDYAQEFLNHEVEMYENNFDVSESKIVKLEKLHSFNQLTGFSIELWKIEYRIKPENIDEVVMAGGMNQIDGWITEDASMGKPILVFSFESDSPKLLGSIKSGEMGSTISGYEIALREFMERNNLISNESYPGNHAVAKFLLSTGETSQLLLSQPSRQGGAGIWCVERWMDGNGSVYYDDPQVDLALTDYYDNLQKQCDEGHRVGLLDPEQVAYEYIIVTLGQTTALEEIEIMNPTSVQDFYETPISTYIGFVSDFNLEKGFFHLDRIEWITYDDEERINELGLSKDDDMPGGFYIYNPASYPQFFEVNENTEYIFHNHGNEWNYSTSDASEFFEYLNTYKGGWTPPFWIVTKDGCVRSITEQYVP
ncbi:MAG: hypothetical protein JJE29_07000 [Peptostreptococcaceae bacterium]|nr:hypothetical protein [Peptostreptococcaceae bacterium]